VLQGRELGVWPIRLGLLPVVVPVGPSVNLRGLRRPIIGDRVVTVGTTTAFGRNLLSTTVHVPRRPLAELCEVEAINLTGDSRRAPSVRWTERVIRLDGRPVSVLEATDDEQRSLVARRATFSLSIVADGVDPAELAFATTRHVEGFLDMERFYEAMRLPPG